MEKHPDDRNQDQFSKIPNFVKIPKISIDPKKVVLIIVGIVLFFLIMDLNNRLSELTKLSAQQEKASTVINELESTLDYLQTQVAYATSVAAVEEWAYLEGHMTREGEKLIIPLPGPEITPSVEVTPSATPVTIRNWQVWLALLSGD